MSFNVAKYVVGRFFNDLQDDEKIADLSQTFLCGPQLRHLHRRTYARTHTRTHTHTHMDTLRRIQ